MRQNKLIEKITASQLRDDIPEFRAGDTVRVHARIVEGSRERIQMFEGVVIKRHGAGISATYTVRKISNGVGVERTFPLHSPRVAKIDVLRHGRVRRAKLYYLRARTGKATRIAERRRRPACSTGRSTARSASPSSAWSATCPATPWAPSSRRSAPGRARCWR